MKWAQANGEAERVSANHAPTSHSVKWDQYSLSEQDQERLRQRFDAGKPIAIRIPVPLHKKGDAAPRTSHMDVFVQRTNDGSTVRPVFFRGSGVIPDHGIKRVQDAVAIIRSSGDALSELLRAAEDPGHKEWSTETDNFAEIKDTYKFPKSYLTLAREAALTAIRLLQDLEAEEDFDLLADVFSLPKESDEKNRPGGGSGKKRKKKTKPVVTADPSPKIITLVQTAGGFTVAPASSESPTPQKIRIRAAYDMRSKNPFKQWEPADFEFGKAPVTIDEQSGVKISLCEGNRIVFDVTSDDYRVSISGFDIERGDLIVEARPEGRFHD